LDHDFIPILPQPQDFHQPSLLNLGQQQLDILETIQEILVHPQPWPTTAGYTGNHSRNPNAPTTDSCSWEHAQDSLEEVMLILGMKVW
jgi:hypothetical protein